MVRVCCVCQGRIWYGSDHSGDVDADNPVVLDTPDAHEIFGRDASADALGVAGYDALEDDDAVLHVDVLPVSVPPGLA